MQEPDLEQSRRRSQSMSFLYTTAARRTAMLDPDGSNFVSDGVRIPLKIAEPFPPEKIMDLRLIEEVRKEFEA
jgi:hypothetical protein